MRCQNEPGSLLNDSTVQNLENMFNRAQIWTFQNSSPIGQILLKFFKFHGENPGNPWQKPLKKISINVLNIEKKVANSSKQKIVKIYEGLQRFPPVIPLKFILIFEPKKIADIKPQNLQILWMLVHIWLVSKLLKIIKEPKIFR